MSDALYDCRDAFARTLETLAESNADIVAVCNDSVGSSKLGTFRDKWPDRLINVGIAEQNLVGVSAGLANGGKLPFACAASCFLTGRALEQIKADIAYSDANVKLCGISSGVAYGELGPTHHSTEDFAWTRVIPNLAIVSPADRRETEQAVRFAANFSGPVFLRLSRMPVPDVVPENYEFELGKSVTLKDGSDVTIVANGVLVHRALEAADLLVEQGISARVINMPTIKPIDETAIIKAATETDGIVTCEEHQIYGGMGGAISEVVVQHQPAKMKILGVDGFPPTGSASWLLDHYGMSACGIAKHSLALLGR